LMQPTSGDASKPYVRIGLALGGGGTRGCAHIGVLSVLEQSGIAIDCLAGTSMGAIVGGLYCAGITCKKIAEIVSSKAFQEAFGQLPNTLGLVVLPIAVIPRALAGASYSGLFHGNEFAAYMASHLPEDRKLIEQLPLPFAAVAFNLLDGNTCAITSGDIGRALQASSAIPEFRQPVPWQGRLLVDGGVVANLPCSQSRELGADIVIGVNVNERLFPLSDTQFKKIGSVSDRCVTANLNKLDEYAQLEADVVIRPEVSGIKLLSRSEVDMQRAILEGERAATLALPAIKKAIKDFFRTEQPAEPLTVDSVRPIQGI
jgi:NTE family protein